MTSPGDTISFTFKVVNDGNYNASISSINIGTPACTGIDATSNTNVCGKLTYTLTDENGSAIQVGDTVYVKDSQTMKVTLLYQEFSDASLLPTEDVSISNLDITINYQQSGSALVKDNGEVADYKVYKQGDKITLNSEDYWVIEDSGAGQDFVVALKDIALTQMVYGTTSDYDTSSVRTYLDNWTTTTFINDELKEVNGYKARLITYNELRSIISYSWHKGFAYYTMSPAFGTSTTSVYYIQSGGFIDDNWKVNASNNVRPVINVYKSALEDSLD